jgi:DNA-binding XRE family transcriptional regulator
LYKNICIFVLELYKLFAGFCLIPYNEFVQRRYAMQTIGERVKAAREQRGIKQAALARRLGCSVNALSMLEKDAITDPRASRIIGIAEALQVSSDYLLGLQDTVDAVHTPASAPPKRPRTRKAAPVA